MIPGGPLISGSSFSSSSKDPSISGASGGRDGSLMIMGSPGGRPGGFGSGPGMVSWMMPRTIRTVSSDFALACIGLPSRRSLETKPHLLSIVSQMIIRSNLASCIDLVPS